MDKKSMFQRGYSREYFVEEVASSPSPEITLDDQQQEIVNSTAQHIIVVAGAGSGKTRVLTERVKHLLTTGTMPHNLVAITFTNLAAEEMRARLKDVDGIGDAFIGTIHSFANRLMKESGKDYKLFNDEIDLQYHTYLIEKYCKFIKLRRWIEYRDLRASVEMGKANEHVANTFLTESERSELMLIERKQKDMIRGSFDSETYPEYVQLLCDQDGVITFDQLLEMAREYFESLGASVEHVLVDELQDIGSLEYQFIMGLKASHYFLVGDDYQCQPAGTKVLMKDGTEKDIKDVQVGDSVITYLTDGKFHFSGSSNKSRDYKVLDKSIHTTSRLYEIETATGKKSQYTGNHKCFVRMKSLQGYVVYIMSNIEGKYRIGMTKLYSNNHFAFGLRARMRSEGFQSAWVLNIFDNPHDAWLCEQLNSLKYTIPQFIFQFDKVGYTKEDVDYIYSHIGDLESRVKMCLDKYGRDINYPFVSMFDGTHISRTHAFVTQACNLVPKYMEVLEYDSKIYRNVRVSDNSYMAHIPAYTTLTSLTLHDCQEKVYGLKVEKYEAYVADGVLTHNSIYGFKGGNVNIFMSLVDDPAFTTYYLTTNYRNAGEILRVAKTVIDQVDKKIAKTVMIHREDATGVVQVSNKAKVENYLLDIKRDKAYRDWFILTRSNKELFEMSNRCERLGIPFVTFKREGMSLAELQIKMKSNKVKILTVHTSKGLEAKNVLLYGSFPVHCPPYRVNTDERKVMYVGVTRAEDNLIILN